MLLALCLVGALSAPGATTVAADGPRDGDLIFHTSRSSQSLAIQHATRSPYSHMGMVLYRGGRPFVFEASATVRFTPFDVWVARGDGGHYVIKRLRDAEQRLTAARVQSLRDAARRFEGRQYDLTFEWSDRRMYCSELVWKIYKEALAIEVGALQRLGEFRLDHPAVRVKLRERYGSRVPLDEPVISPSAMFDWPGLLTIVTR